MTIRIHHTQHKQAAKFGVTLVANGTGVTATHAESGTSIKANTAAEALAQVLQSVGVSVKGLVARLKAAPKSPAKSKKVRKARKPRRSSDEDEDGEDEDEDGEQSRSVVKRKYKTKYKPFKAKCGDELSLQITKHLTVKDEDGKPCIDQDKLVRFAKANECWDPAYRNVNGGMRRMNVANRLRAKVRKGYKVVWAQ